MTPGTKATLSLAGVLVWIGTIIWLFSHGFDRDAFVLAYAPMVVSALALVWFMLREAFDPECY